ncbi:MAG: hypothetical protein HRT61_15645 [Ekhidna sp.]|nr:hypothetical protein [Ekhidna sp.]
MKKNSFLKAEWDKKNSTFRSEMKPTGWIGYSKKIDHPERKDSISLLTNWILRLYRDGYLRESRKPYISEVSFYFNQTGEHIVTFHWDCPEWNSSIMSDQRYSRLVDFGDKFYDLVRSNTNPDIIYQKLYVRNVKSNPFNLDLPRFSSKDNLASYCADLVRREQHVKGDVDEFYNKYVIKYFPDVREDTSYARDLASRLDGNR